MRIEKTNPSEWYCITCTSSATVYAELDGIPVILVALKQEGQATFCAPSNKVTIDTDGTCIVLPTEAPGGLPFGGHLENHLTIGHGASDAVAAVCTLTLGDPAAEGDLTDNQGNALHLDAAPATYAHDFWPMTSPTAGGVLVVGEHTFAEVSADAGAPATAAVTPLESYAAGTTYYLDVEFDPMRPPWNFEWTPAEGETSAQDFETALNDITNWTNVDELPFTAELDTDTGKVVFTTLEVGIDQNVYQVQANTAIQETEYIQFSGGDDPRTLDEALALAVETINSDEDSPIRAEIAEVEDVQGIAVYALESGSGHNYSCADTTGDFFQVSATLTDGADARTLAQVVAAITAEGSDFADEVDAALVEGTSTATLTAKVAGKAANAVTYTAAGCFGSGSVKQGSTTHGKDAVAQTAYQINLNGAPLDVEPAPLPTALTPATAMRNSGVYTVDAAITATAITIPANATAEIWVRFGATSFNVELPPSWVWVNGEASDMTGKTHTTFCIAVRNDGAKVLASMQYNYDTTPAQS